MNSYTGDSWKKHIARDGEDAARKKSSNVPAASGSEVAPGLEGRPGAKPKIEGENAYAKLRLQEAFLERQLENRYGRTDFLTALKEMTPDEVDAWPTMQKPEVAALAARLAERLEAKRKAEEAAKQQEFSRIADGLRRNRQALQAEDEAAAK